MPSMSAAYWLRKFDWHAPASDPISLFLCVSCHVICTIEPESRYESIIHLGKTGLSSKAVSVFLFFLSGVEVRTSVRVAIPWLHNL